MREREREREGGYPESNGVFCPESTMLRHNAFNVTKPI